MQTAQEVGATFIVEDGLVVMAGVEFVEWYQTHGLRSSHYYEPSFPQQPPVADRAYATAV